MENKFIMIRYAAMGQGYPHFSSNGEHIGEFVSKHPKTIALTVALTSLLLLAINNKDTTKGLIQKNDASYAQDSTSTAATKRDDEIAAHTLLMNTIQ